MLTEKVLIAVAEHFPDLTRGAARLAEDALGSARLTRAFGFSKSPGQMLTDLANHFPDLKIAYPDKASFTHAPVGELKSDFIKQRNALSSALKPAEGFLPHLGFHGTSEPFGAKILTSRQFQPIDFATATTDHTQLPAGTFISGTGKGMETAVSFSNKWRAVDGSPSGPVFVIDVAKADSLAPMWKGDVRHPLQRWRAGWYVRLDARSAQI